MLDFLGYTIAFLFLIIVVILLLGFIVTFVVLGVIAIRSIIEEWRCGDGNET